MFVKASSMDGKRVILIAPHPRAGYIGTVDGKFGMSDGSIDYIEYRVMNDDGVSYLLAPKDQMAPVDGISRAITRLK